MEGERQKIKSFTDLEAWKESHRLTLDIYRATEKFPSNEVFGLTSQMRRAAVSIVSNIAEGFSRNSMKEKAQFYAIAKGSNTELQSQLLVARDIGYLEKILFDTIAKRTIQASRLLTGLIRKCKNT